MLNPVVHKIGRHARAADRRHPADDIVLDKAVPEQSWRGLQARRSIGGPTQFDRKSPDAL